MSENIPVPPIPQGASTTGLKPIQPPARAKLQPGPPPQTVKGTGLPGVEPKADFKEELFALKKAIGVKATVLGLVAKSELPEPTKSYVTALVQGMAADAINVDCHLWVTTGPGKKPRIKLHMDIAAQF